MWEVRALMDHYHPTVARAAHTLEIPKLSKPEMSIEAVMKSSYASLFEVGGASAIALLHYAVHHAADGPVTSPNCVHNVRW